jgi:hypothetical protein
MADFHPGSELFELIHAMDAKERRYFKLSTRHMGRTAEKKYLLIYDFLLQQPSWSEAALRAAFAQEAFVKQLHVACAYLQEKLVAALRGYDEDRLFNLEVSRRLDGVAVLFERRLYGQCLGRVRLALRYAQRMDLPHFHLQLLHWEIRILRLHGSRENWVRMVAAMAESEALTAVIAQENMLHTCYSRLYAVLAWPTKALPLDRAQVIRTVTDDPALRCDPAALPFDAALVFHSIRAYLAFEQGDEIGYAQVNAEKRACWERNAARMRTEESRYFRALVGFVESAIEVQRYAEAGDAIQRMERLCRRNKLLAKTQHLLLLHLKLRYHLNLRDFTKALESIRAFRDVLEMRKAAVPPPHFDEACTNAALVNFICGDWVGCLEWLALAAPHAQKKGARVGIVQVTGAMRLMAFYAAGQLEAFEKALRAWQRQAETSLASDVLFQGFGNLIKARTEAQERSTLTQLLADLQQFSDVLETRELIRHWIQSRLEGRPLRDYYPLRSS